VRLAIAILIFANIAWYGWTHWISRPDETVASAATTAGKGLMLAREAAPSKAPVAPRTPRDNCLSLGPFTDLTDASRASTLLHEKGLEPRQRAGEGVVWRGYWVTLDVPDRATSNTIIERLRRAGVGDAYALPGDGRNVTISLGLFSERQRALRRMDDAKRSGSSRASPIGRAAEPCTGSTSKSCRRPNCRTPRSYRGRAAVSCGSKSGPATKRAHKAVVIGSWAS